jgi:hypothetical protein
MQTADAAELEGEVVPEVLDRSNESGEESLAAWRRADALPRRAGHGTSESATGSDPFGTPNVGAEAHGPRRHEWLGCCAES